MDTLWPEQIFNNQPKLIEKLVKGKESADKLRALLQQPYENDNGSVSAEELAVKILTSFTETLSMLRFSGSNDHEMFPIDGCDGSDREAGSPKISDGNKNIKPLGVRERRGCYQRRNVSGSRIKVSPTIEDGYAWRKYGQKDILNTKYPRCYFRCTHKYDQGCKATKQVQLTKQDPLLYQITYFANHTCSADTLRAPHIITELDPIDSSYHLSFQSKSIPITATKPPADAFSSSAVVPPPAAISRETQSDASAGKNSSALTSCHPWRGQVFTSEASGSHREEVVSSSFNSNYYNNNACLYAAEPLRDLDVEDFTKLDDLYFDDNDFLLGLQ